MVVVHDDKRALTQEREESKHKQQANIHGLVAAATSPSLNPSRTRLSAELTVMGTTGRSGCLALMTSLNSTPLTPGVLCIGQDAVRGSFRHLLQRFRAGVSGSHCISLDREDVNEGPDHIAVIVYDQDVWVFIHPSYSLCAPLTKCQRETRSLLRVSVQLRHRSCVPSDSGG